MQENYQKKISLKGIENYNMQINHKKYQILRNLRVRWEEFEIKHDNSLTQLGYVVPDVPTIKTVRVLIWNEPDKMLGCIFGNTHGVFRKICLKNNIKHVI